MADPPRSVSTCWFGENKPTAMELKPRTGSTDLSEVSCCERASSLAEALRNFKGSPNLYGFDNALSLILYRANGETTYDENEALNRKICHSHFQSIYSNWSKSKHLRRTRKAGKEITLCSLPSSYHPHSRPISKTAVNKTQSIYWLESHGELIHPGVVICVPHIKMFNDHSESTIDFGDNTGDLDLDSQANFDSCIGDTSSNYCSSLIVFISSICKIIGITRLITTKGQWENLSEDTKTRKRRAFRSMVMELAKALVGNPYPCSTRHCTKTFTTVEDLESHVFRQDHSFVKLKETILDIAKKEISVSIETQEAARISVDESEILFSRSDKLTHDQGWAIKEARAPRMNAEVQEFAKKFFFAHRAEGRRANAAECCELIRNEKNPSGSYRFLLSICPTEKALTSSFGTWENQRLRPKAVASRKGGRKVTKIVTATTSKTSSSKRSYESSDDENNNNDEEDIDAIEEEEEEEEEKIDDEAIIASLVEEISNEIFLIE